jgi:hypothetical protein
MHPQSKEWPQVIIFQAKTNKKNIPGKILAGLKNMC